MIDLNTLQWDNDLTTADSATAEKDGYTITIYTDFQDYRQWVLYVESIENRRKNAQSDSTQKWPLLDELFGRKHWQAYLDECQTRREVANRGEYFRVYCNAATDEAAILLPGRDNDNHGLTCDNPTVHDELETYDDCLATLESELLDDLVLVEKSEQREVYRGKQG